MDAGPGAQPELSQGDEASVASMGSGFAEKSLKETATTAWSFHMEDDDTPKNNAGDSLRPLFERQLLEVQELLARHQHQALRSFVEEAERSRDFTRSRGTASLGLLEVEPSEKPETPPDNDPHATWTPRCGLKMPPTLDYDPAAQNGSTTAASPSQQPLRPSVLQRGAPYAGLTLESPRGCQWGQSNGKATLLQSPATQSQATRAPPRMPGGRRPSASSPLGGPKLLSPAHPRLSLKDGTTSSPLNLEKGVETPSGGKRGPAFATPVTPTPATPHGVFSLFESAKEQLQTGLFADVSLGQTTESKGLFADVDAVKRRLRNAICVRQYHVFDVYKSEGVFQWLARSQWFELFTLFVILANAVWMSIDVDHNHSEILTEASFHFQFAEHLFCFYFTFEVVVRFCAFRRTCDALRDTWFLFDTVLVALMIAEIWVITVIITMKGDNGSNNAILRTLGLLRLLRVARVARLLRACPEVMILIKGVLLAVPSVFFTLLLLVCLLYVFGVAFAELTRGTPAGNSFFSSVPAAMSTLLLHGCLGENLPDVVYMLGAESRLLAVLLMVFVLLASLIVMNLLMAALVEIVQVVSSAEKETLIVSFMKAKLQVAVDELEPNNTGFISKLLFAQVLEHPVAIRALRDVGVDVVELVDFFDFIFSEGEEVGFSDLIEMLLQLRGTNKATRKDIIDLRKNLQRELGELEQRLGERPNNRNNQPIFRRTRRISAEP